MIWIVHVQEEAGGRMTSWVSVVVLTVLLSIQTLAADVFEPNDHCVAWRTRKVMFVLSTVYPVGKNCKISSKLVSNKGSWVFHLSLSHENFDSDEEDRDEEVSKLLGGNRWRSLEFQSEAISQAQINELNQGRKIIINGVMKIAGKEYQVRALPLKFDGTKFYGKYETNYTQFELKPPTIAGGLVAKVSNYLALHYQFQLSQIDGNQKIRRLLSQ